MIQAWIEHFSYLGIFGALIPGGLGVPIPEEAVIIAAGVLAHQEVVRWWLAFPLCFVGVLAGDCLLYWAGHRWGDRVVQSRSFRWLLTEQRLERLKAAYRRRGVVILVGARHMMGLRAAAMIGAGIVRVPFWKFLITDLAAAIPGVGVGSAWPFSSRATSRICSPGCTTPSAGGWWGSGWPWCAGCCGAAG